MGLFLAVCAGVITISVAYAAWHFVETMKQLRATAQAVEYLAINANDKVEATRGLFNAVSAISNTVQSFWFKAAQCAAAVVSGRVK
ncbi:MAG: hypothetical protein WC421_00720 [Elusimicrobiales bacterium]